MIVSIHQPNHLPYLGFFDKMAASDVMILYDSAQFARYDIGFQNRNKIRTKEGWIWLTVPVKHNFGAKINELEIDNSKKWAKKNWTSIVANYAKAPYFKDYKDHYEEIFGKEWKTLGDVNTEIIMKTAKLLGIKTKLVLASELASLESKGPQALLDLCKKIGAKVYLSGTDGKKYISDEMKKEFEKNGIKIIYQEYTHPEYNQIHGNFEPYMCILDLMFNHGPESLKILRNK